MVKYNQFTILLVSLFLTACSQYDIEELADDPYVPFPYDSVESVSPKGSKVLDDKKLFVRIEPGEFLMGSPKSEFGRGNDERQHLVKITKPFWISRFEITNEDWNKHSSFASKRGKLVYFFNKQALKEFIDAQDYDAGNYTISEFDNIFYFEMVIANHEVQGNWEIELGSRKSYKIDSKKFPNLNSILGNLKKLGIKSIGRLGQKNPVTHVSYSEATAFCWKLTNHAYQNNLLAKGLYYRLPTEAEWEYACRAGNTGFCGLGEGTLLSGTNACLNGSRPEFVLGGGSKPMLFNRKRIAPINKNKPKYQPNKWGLHDMHGNVMEWCSDYYAPYPEQPILMDPSGPFNGSRRVVRGGSFYRTAHDCRSASRASYEATYRGSEIGFRLVIGHRLL